VPFSGSCRIVVGAAIGNHDRPFRLFGGWRDGIETMVNPGCAVQRGYDYGKGGQGLTPVKARLTL
jgi:hypothetical protein